MKRTVANPLKYEPFVYTPAGSRRLLTPQEARKEYMRLRSLAIKRLKRFEGTEFTDTQIYRANRNAYPAQSTLSDRELRAKLSNLARFVTSAGSSVQRLKSVKTKSLATLHRHGYTGINSGNFQQFGEYMEEARSRASSSFFDSERAATLYEEMQDERPAEEILREYEEYAEKQLERSNRIRAILDELFDFE